MRICKKCKEEQTLDNFPVYSKNKCRLCLNKSTKENQLKNKDSHLIKKRARYYKNRDKILADKRDYDNKNRDIIRIKARKHYAENRDRKVEEARIYRKNNPDKILETREKNKPKARKYQKERYHSCPTTNLITRLRKRTRAALKTKSFRKTKGTLDYLGCTGKELQAHIESLFKDGMNWENKHLWHVDHIIPISLGNTEEEILRLNHYTNLQPLWALDNLKKSDKIIKPQKEEELCQEQQVEKD